MKELAGKLPPEPSAAVARWDPDRSADDYLQQASMAINQTEARLSIFRELSFPDKWFEREIFRSEKGKKKFHEAQFQFQSRGYLSRLLDKSNWASERPQLTVSARVNQAGNLVMSWWADSFIILSQPYPLNNPGLIWNKSGLKDEFLIHNEVSGDPHSTTLLWFRDVPLRWQSEVDHPATRYIMYAIRAKFGSIVNELRQSLEVITFPELSFTRDDETGVEMIIGDKQGNT